jgi:hypothetical protein
VRSADLLKERNTPPRAGTGLLLARSRPSYYFTLRQPRYIAFDHVSRHDLLQTPDSRGSFRRHEPPTAKRTVYPQHIRLREPVWRREQQCSRSERGSRGEQLQTPFTGRRGITFPGAGPRNMDGLPERRRYRSRCQPTTTFQPFRIPHKPLLLAIYPPKPPLTARRLSQLRRPQATFDHGRLAHETPFEYQDAFGKCREYECGPHCAGLVAGFYAGAATDAARCVTSEYCVGEEAE